VRVVLTLGELGARSSRGEEVVLRRRESRKESQDNAGKQQMKR